MKRVWMIALAWLSASAVSSGQTPSIGNGQPGNGQSGLRDATAYVYKKASGVDLKLWVFSPSDLKASDARRPAILLFSGGGWKQQNPAKFAPHARHFARKGLVAMIAEYRVRNPHQTTPYQAVADGKSAVRWVREHAKELHIAPNALIVGGGSAGGHIALATALVKGFDEPGENPAISSRPDALVLFNPVPNTVPDPKAALSDRQRKALQLLGPRAQEISPLHLLGRNLPPTIIFHGKADKLVPFAASEEFCRKANQLGNRCELIGFEGVGHGFFHQGRDGGTLFRETLTRTDQFLKELGFLP